MAQSKSNHEDERSAAVIRVENLTVVASSAFQFPLMRGEKRDNENFIVHTIYLFHPYTSNLHHKLARCMVHPILSNAMIMEPTSKFIKADRSLFL